MRASLPHFQLHPLDPYSNVYCLVVHLLPSLFSQSQTMEDMSFDKSQIPRVAIRIPPCPGSHSFFTSFHSLMRKTSASPIKYPDTSNLILLIQETNIPSPPRRPPPSSSTKTSTTQQEAPTPTPPPRTPQPQPTPLLSPFHKQRTKPSTRTSAPHTRYQTQ